MNPLTIFEKSYILDVRLCSTCLGLVVNEVWVDEESISLIRMKDQSISEWCRCRNVEQWAKMYSACVDTKSKPWNTSKYLLDMRYGNMNAVTQSVFKADCEIVQF